ncbi:hypothetical protein [Staphylococcus nepalensis]|uniref:hypothetical protein n=1 Tax=Staphylococcus nepalensis TaxID=214473 RepID=UPI002301E30C|nr:hypothetical protein [Staphylococcus nepalensis]
MTSEEYQLLENNIPKANNVSNEEYEQLLNEQVQKIANENNHSIETPMAHLRQIIKMKIQGKIKK